MIIGFILLNAPEFGKLLCAVILSFAIVFGPSVEILLAFDIEQTEKLVIIFEKLVKFKSS